MEIRTLRADEIDCRVQSVKAAKNGQVGAVLLLYKDARADMKILDETFGMFGWSREHTEISGNLFCTIRIKNPDSGEWVAKQDVGTESNQDAQKGEASDAFKRAATNVGIGRELYTSPFIYVVLDKGEYWDDKGKLKASQSLKFTVSEISYNKDRVIDKLMLKDGKGQARFTFYNKESTQAPTKRTDGRDIFETAVQNESRYQ